MNEWPENLTGLDLKWTWAEILKVLLNWSLPVLLLLGIGIAQATELPAVLVTETAAWLDFGAWLTDGAASGFDGAGAAYAGW